MATTGIINNESLKVHTISFFYEIYIIFTDIVSHH